MRDHDRFFYRLYFVKYPVEYITVPVPTLQGTAAGFRRDILIDFHACAEILSVGPYQHDPKSLVDSKTALALAQRR